MDDKELVKKIRKGDRDAFNILVENYQSKVIHICFGMLSDYEDACDAAQEVFVKVYRNIENFRGESSVSTWIYRITKNTCMDSLRKRREKVISIDEEKDDGSKIEIEDRSYSPEETAEKNETRKLVYDALNGLDENQRLVITMYDIEGFSYDEISNVLGVPVGTVKSRLSRAREKLKQNLYKKRELYL